jgi:hypothetical protein
MDTFAGAIEHHQSVNLIRVHKFLKFIALHQFLRLLTEAEQCLDALDDIFFFEIHLK